MVSTAQLYPEELPDRDKSYDTAEPDLSYYYKVPRRFHSHERTQSLPATDKEARGDYVSVFFDKRGKHRDNFSKLYIRKKDKLVGPKPTSYDTNPKWDYDRFHKGERTLKFLPSARRTFIDDVIHVAKRRSTPGPDTYRLNHVRTERRSQQFSPVKQEQLQMIGATEHHSLDRPSPDKYKPTYVSSLPMSLNASSYRASLRCERQGSTTCGSRPKRK